MRPIDADELMQNIRRHCIIPGWCYPLIELEINDAPTIEAVPVVHGEWIAVDFSYCCSICGEENACAFDCVTGRYADLYCPKCGAKMKAV